METTDRQLRFHLDRNEFRLMDQIAADGISLLPIWEISPAFMAEAKQEGEEVALEREFWKEIEFEKPWNAEPLQYTFRLDEPKKAKANTKSIVIKARIQNLTTEDEWDDYKITGQFLKDQDGKEYQPVDTEVISRKNWNGIRMKPGGEAIVSLAFEVPKNKENFNFILSRASQPGDVVIKHIDKGL